MSDSDALYFFSVASTVYALVVGAGTGYLYKTDKSMLITIGGVLSSLVLLITSIITYFKAHEMAVWGCLAIVTAFLMIVGIVMYFLFPKDGQKKIFPYGVLAVVSLVILIFDLIALIVIAT